MDTRAVVIRNWPFHANVLLQDLCVRINAILCKHSL